MIFKSPRKKGSKVRLAAITLLTNLVEIHTAREIFELSINGFYHEEFRIREGCCLFVLSVIKRLGNSEFYFLKLISRYRTISHGK